MNAREFFVKIPYLVGAQNAARISQIFAYTWERELSGDSPFDRNELDRRDRGNRSSYLWAMLFSDSSAYIGAVEHCKAIMELIELGHYSKEHGEADQHSKRITELVEALKSDEGAYPEIDSAMPLETAVALGGWNG